MKSLQVFCLILIAAAFVAVFVLITEKPTLDPKLLEEMYSIGTKRQVRIGHKS